MKLTDRAVLFEIVPTFAFGVLAFTALLLGVGGIYEIIRLAADYSVSAATVVQVFLLKMPWIVALTLPMSALFSVLLAFSRFSTDLEMTAWRSGGVSFARLLAPTLVFGFTVSVLTLLMNDTLAPMANTRFNELVEQIKVEAGEKIRKENALIPEFGDEGLKSVLYADSMEGRRLVDVCYTQMENGRVSKITIAREAVWVDNVWRFRNGSQLLFNSAGELKNLVTFERLDIIFKQKLEDMARQKTRAGDYTFRELKDRIELLEKQQIEKTALNKLKVDFHSKLAIPFASFTFALIAAPLGLKPQRSGSSVGFGLSIIIILIYYISQMILRGLGQAFLNPALAAWLPNIALMAAGAALCFRASR
jgi:lipopolysaccharide export system permease protein